MAKITNQKVLKATGEIVETVLSEKESVLLTASEEKQTVEISVDKVARIFVHEKGIRVTAANTPNNRDLGLEELKSDKKWACKVFPLDQGIEVGKVILNMD